MNTVTLDSIFEYATVFRPISFKFTFLYYILYA